MYNYGKPTVVEQFHLQFGLGPFEALVDWTCIFIKAYEGYSGNAEPSTLKHVDYLPSFRPLQTIQTKLICSPTNCTSLIRDQFAGE